MMETIALNQKHVIMEFVLDLLFVNVSIIFINITQIFLGSDDTDCNDGNPCTIDTCESSNCTFVTLEEGTPCSDGNFCNGNDTCGSDGYCSIHTGNPCLDGPICQNTCNQATSSCFSFYGLPCPDTIFCNGEEICDGNGTCISPGNPCLQNSNCSRHCNEESRNCFDPKDTPCDDGLFCNGEDLCDGKFKIFYILLFFFFFQETDFVSHITNLAKIVKIVMKLMIHVKKEILE